MKINATNILEQLGRGQLVSRATVVDMAQTIAKYETDILALYDRQREDGNTIAALRAAAPQKPFMYAIMEPNGSAYMDEFCVAGNAEDLYSTLNGMNDSPDAAYTIVPVYLAVALAAPAPPQPTESELLALLPGVYYMDQPDGGSVTLLEQLQRMAKDAERYRKARKWAYALSIGNPTPDEFDANVDSVVE